MKPRITLIAAMDENRCIGGGNTMLWHIPADFAFFKQYTIGKPIIMGRKTWASLPKKPLPERRNIVLSRDNKLNLNGADCFADLQVALNACANANEIVIIGGSQIYHQALPLADEMRLTEIHAQFNGDAFFPEFDRAIWQEISREPQTCAKSGLNFDFVHYRNTSLK